MIGILLHKRDHRVLDGSEPKVKTKRIEFISEAAFLFFLHLCFKETFLISHQRCAWVLYDIYKKNPLKNNLTSLGMVNDFAAKNNGGYWTFYESFSQQVGKIGRQSRLFISVYSIY